MQLQWFQAFITIAKYKNFSDAAEELFVSQSSLSKQIQALEKDLDVRLFNRTTRSLELTPIAHKLLEDSSYIINCYEHILQAVKDYKNENNNSIRLACTPILHLYGLSDCLYSFTQNFPNLQLLINETNHENAIRALRSGNADMAITRVESDTLYDDYNITSLYDDELVILCNSHHPISKNEPITLSKALDQNLFLLQGSHECLNSLLKHYQLSLDQAHIKGTLNGFAIASILKHESAISLMVLSMATIISSLSGLQVIRLSERPPYPVRIITKKNRSSPAMDTLIHYLKDSFSSTNM